MKKIFILFVFAVFVLFFSAYAAAEENLFGAGLLFGLHEPINAGDSYKAVYSSAGVQYGIIFDYRILEWLDLDLRITRFTKSGHRVLIDDNGQITETSNPEDLEILSFTAGARWIFVLDDEYAPYVGAAIGSWSLSTESNVGEYHNTYDKTGVGIMIMAGVQLFQNNPFSLGLDLNYSSVPDMIGDEAGSTSYYYGETDIGGFSANIVVQYRF